MRARILGTGKNGCMKNEIVLDVFEAFAIKDLVTKAIEADKGEKYHSYDRKKWEEFMNIFHMAFTVPSEMEEADLRPYFKN